MKVDEKNISLLREYFKDKPVLKAFLFGSTARNTDSAGNDIDILVELDYSEPIGLEFVQMQMDLEELLHKYVDLVSLSGLSDYIKPFIEKDKILVYTR